MLEEGSRASLADDGRREGGAGRVARGIGLQQLGTCDSNSGRAPDIAGTSLDWLGRAGWSPAWSCAANLVSAGILRASGAALVPAPDVPPRRRHLGEVRSGRDRCL